MNLSRLISGLAIIFISLILIGFSVKSVFTLIYGIPMFIVGIIILLNKEEDKIEKRKDLKANQDFHSSMFLDGAKHKMKGGKK